jgi:hypothetical protein
MAKHKTCDWCGDEYEVAAMYFCEMRNGKFICEYCIPDEFDNLFKYIKALENEVELYKFYKVEHDLLVKKTA